MGRRGRPSCARADGAYLWDVEGKRYIDYVGSWGPRGAHIRLRDGSTIEIPPARERQIVDPTGRRDAYRAGLIFALMRGMDWPTVGRAASLMGALKVEHPGTQNQHFDLAAFGAEFKEQFGYELPAGEL